MTEPIQLIPSLTLLEDSGEFTVRIGGEKWAAELGRKLVSIIGEMGIARKLTILTPGDTKVFKFDSPVTKALTAFDEATKNIPVEVMRDVLRPSQRISQDSAAPPAPEIVGELEEELRAQQLAEKEMEAANRLARADAGITDPVEENVVEMPTRKRGRPSKVEASLKTATSCGRCGGGGALEGGGTCPVCRGAGSIAHYGRGR